MKIGLFIPCYIDAVFPEVGIAMPILWPQRAPAALATLSRKL